MSKLIIIKKSGASHWTEGKNRLRKQELGAIGRDDGENSFYTLGFGGGSSFASHIDWKP